ncbi:hypothetical protein Tco_1101405, partial [Tanacetum coccineum]
MGKVRDKVFTVNLHHDGVFICNPVRYVYGELKQITDIDFEDYDVLGFLTIEGNVNDTPFESSDEYESSDDVEEIDYVDFHTEGEENVVIKNLSTQDPFLNKLCSNHGSFNGFIDEPQPVDQELIDDPDAASIDPLFKVKRGVSYPKHDPTIPWNEMQPVLGMRYEHPEQLKLALANYGVANGYQLWYMRNDWRCMLVYCGRNVEAGRCAGMYSNKKYVAKRKLFADDSPRQALLESNPGSTCRLDVEETSCGESYLQPWAVAGYMHLNRDPDEGVSHCYLQDLWRMPGRPRKERIKAPSENNSQVSRVGRVMRCSNCQGIGHNKASCDKEPVSKAPIQRKPLGRTRQSVFETHASAKGRGRGSRGERGAKGGRNGSGRGARGGSANRGQQLMDEDEIRQNLEHDYMQDLLDA